jgi:hypothetical protein
MDSFAIRSCEANGGSLKVNCRAVSFLRARQNREVSLAVVLRRPIRERPRPSLFDNLQTPQGFVDLGANQHAFLDISLAL